MYYVGIDPGKSGCLCVLSEDMKDVAFFDYPKDDDITTYLQTLSGFVERYKVRMAILEKVHSMPRQGVASTFTFGVNFGMWKAFLTMSQIPHRIVTPQQWMKGLVVKSDGADTKTAVKNVVLRLFPKADIFGAKGAYKDGRGDALLMAYCARQFSKS